MRIVDPCTLTPRKLFRNINETLVLSLMRSMKENGFDGTRPILVEGRVVTDGNHRLEVAKRLGIKVAVADRDMHCGCCGQIIRKGVDR